MDRAIAECFGKSRFDSPAAAHNLLGRYRKNNRRRNGREHLDVYRCRFCGGWHLGSKSLQSRHYRLPAYDPADRRQWIVGALEDVGGA
jgi:hypothetical protein